MSYSVPVSKRWDFINKNKSHKRYETTKCGCAVFTEDLKSIVLIQNIYSYKSGIEQWGLPKGQIETNETFSICAKRELYEETGLDLNITDNMFKSKVMNSYYFTLIVNTKLKLNPKDNTEIKYAKWFKVEDLDILPINRETRLFMKYTYSNIKKKL